MIEAAKVETRYQLSTASMAVDEMEHKGYISKDLSHRHGAGRRIQIFGQIFSTKYVMYGIAYASSCWAWAAVVTTGITLHGVSRIRRGVKRDVLPSSIVRFLSLCFGGWLRSSRPSRAAPRRLWALESSSTTFTTSRVRHRY